VVEGRQPSHVLRRPFKIGAEGCKPSQRFGTHRLFNGALLPNKAGRTGCTLVRGRGAKKSAVESRSRLKNIVVGFLGGEGPHLKKIEKQRPEPTVCYPRKRRVRGAETRKKKTMGTSGPMSADLIEKKENVRKRRVTGRERMRFRGAPPPGG